MEVVSARLSQCNQLPYMEVKVVVHCKDSAKSCSRVDQCGLTRKKVSRDCGDPWITPSKRRSYQLFLREELSETVTARCLMVVDKHCESTSRGAGWHGLTSWFSNKSCLFFYCKLDDKSRCPEDPAAVVVVTLTMLITES